jgi:acetyltransferase-like isoleucine patch superfamily enzyme
MAERVDVVWMVISWWPACWISCAAWLAYVPSWHHRCWLVLAWLILIPPLLCQLIGRCWPVIGTHGVRSAAARRWWFLQQLQMPFNRLPWIEEGMRLVPGLYQAWLILWGARVSPWCVVAPHVVITDRQLVTIGTGAVLGDGCLLAAHMVVREPTWSITIAAISIGRGSLVGARAVLAPGVVVGDDEMVTAMKPMPPFSRWHGGRRHLKAGDG